MLLFFTLFLIISYSLAYPLNNNLFEGDILMFEEMANLLYSPETVFELRTKGYLHPSRRNLALLKFEQYLWREIKENLFYIVEYSYQNTDGLDDSNYSETEKQIINNYIFDLNNLMKSVRFREINGTSTKHYVKIERGSDDYCATHVGNVKIYTSPQILYLGKNCLTKATIQHEMLHVLGLYHEQSRPDRDDFVEILSKNIITGKESNFRKIENSATSSGVHYDYLSILHYPKNAFSSNGLDTIRTKDASYQTLIGEAEQPSKSDLFQIELMYRCGEIRNYSNFCSSDCPCRRYEGECVSDDVCVAPYKCIDANTIPSNFKVDNPNKVCDLKAAPPSTTKNPSKSPTPLINDPTTNLPTNSPTLNSSLVENENYDILLFVGVGIAALVFFICFFICGYF